MIEKSLSELYVLLVEPSGTQAKIISKELKAAGIENYESVSTGGEAVDYLHKFHPDLVISSMYLPDMTGSDLVHAMRKDDALEDIAFMLISSETGFDEIDPIRQAGACAILPKPFASHQLKRALLNTLDVLVSNEIEFDDINAEDLKVLIVDDSKMARNHIKRILGGLGIVDFTEADDGTSAIPLIENAFFDFVVTDYNMPKMDGKALIEYIRNKSTQQSLPVLMVTSENDKNNLAAVEQAGVSGICDKPFETDTVREIVYKMMTAV